MGGLEVLFGFQLLVPVVRAQLEGSAANAAEDLFPPSLITAEGNIGIADRASEIPRHQSAWVESPSVFRRQSTQCPYNSWR